MRLVLMNALSAFQVIFGKKPFFPLCFFTVLISNKMGLSNSILVKIKLTTEKSENKSNIC